MKGFCYVCVDCVGVLGFVEVVAGFRVLVAMNYMQHVE